MKAALFENLNELKIIEKDKPEIQADEVLVRIEYCGICGSDVHAYAKGELIPLGTVMGHECSGIIELVGKNVKGFSSNERVVIKPIPQCGDCYWCRIGEMELCPKAWENCIGVSPAFDGGFAEYLKVRHPQAMLFKLPETVSLEEAALTEPLAVALHSVRVSKFKLGDKVVVMGAGPIGLGVIRFLKLGSAGKIIAMEVSQKRSELAYQLGADVVLNPEMEGEGLTNKIKELTDGTGADIVFEAAGVPFTFKNAMQFTRSGGQIVVVGFQLKEVSLNPGLLVLKHVNILCSFGYNDAEYKMVIEFLSRRLIKSDLFISDIIPLDAIQEKGFKRLLNSPEAIKIIVKL
jgi:(R,R)-butanediol dehydrogenase / meso-butanediol dehydrogenase / diacetyl reductase